RGPARPLLRRQAPDRDVPVPALLLPPGSPVRNPQHAPDRSHRLRSLRQSPLPPASTPPGEGSRGPGEETGGVDDLATPAGSAGRGRARQAPSSAFPGPEDGGSRPARVRSSSRLQQPL